MLINLMRLRYHDKIPSLTSCLVVHAQILNIRMRLECGDAFVCQTISDYHNVYLQWDVLLLADFFEKFRKTCLEFYSLNPLHCYTTPGLAWDAALRMSRVDLELITDENMCNFVENSIRGGISMISTRHARANNSPFPDTYDSSLPNQNLIYLDTNNLHGFRFSSPKMKSQH